DLLLTGVDTAGGVPVTVLYRNQGGNTFIHINAPNLRSLSDSTAAWGDFDHDGDLDLIEGGWDGSAWSNRVYRNDSCTVVDDSFTMPSGGTLNGYVLDND